MTEADQPPPAALLPLPDLVRAADVAAMFGCNERTIRRWCAAGHLVPIRIGRSVFFRTDDLRRVIATDMAAAIVQRAKGRTRQRSGQCSGAECVSNDTLICAGDFQSD